MLTYTQHSDAVVIVLHEIYGINEHITTVCKKISCYGIDVIVPDLLSGRKAFSYEEETNAYNYFMNNVGFEKAFEQIEELLHHVRENYKIVCLLGYSVGATLAWLSSKTGLCDLAVGFYGSRIRNCIGITPKCPVLLFFPSQEKAFAVDDLILQLSNRHNVQIEKLDGVHGFANQFSRDYHQKSSVKACKEIFKFVKKHKNCSRLLKQCKHNKKDSL